MAYGVVDDVRGVLPNDQKIDNQTGRPTSTGVTTMIARVSAQVDVAISGAGGAVPVTDATLLDAIKLYVSREVAWQIMVTRSVVTDSKTKPLWYSWHDEFLA